MTYGRQPQIDKDIDWVIDEDNNVLGYMKDPATMVQLGGGSSVTVSFSSTVPMDGNKIMARTPISTATQFVVGACVEGGSCVVPVVANGSVTPTFGAGFNADPNGDAWRSVSGALHKIYCYYEDGLAWYLLKDTGLTVAASATALTVSGPSSGANGVASSAITVSANGSLSGSLTVTPSSTVAGAFSPTSATLSSGGNVTFTFTPSATGSATLTFAATGLTSATLAYTVSASATAPGQVTGLTLGTPSGTSQPLTWTAPSDGGSAITDYVVQYSTDNATWTTFADGTSTTASATVTGLTASTLYYYRVAAVNAVGTGSYSTSVSGSTTSASAGVVVRLTSQAGVTESGDATNGWNYVSNTGSQNSWTGVAGGISDLKIPANTDGWFEFTLGAYTSTGFGPLLGLKTSQAAGDYKTSADAVFFQNNATGYSIVQGSGTAAVAPVVIVPASGHHVRIGRTGSDAWVDISTDGGSTYTRIKTWTGGAPAANAYWALLNFASSGVNPAQNIRGFNVTA